MSRKEEPVKQEMKEYKSCTIMMKQVGNETIHAMPSNTEPVMHEVKQYKTCLVRKNQ
jgi:hypothetical protein